MSNTSAAITAQEVVARAMADRGMRVIFHHGGAQIDLKKKTIYLPYGADITQLRGFLDHECGHHLVRESDTVLKRVLATGDKMLEHVFRSLCDCRVNNYYGPDRFPGARANIVRTIGEVLDEKAKQPYTARGKAMTRIYLDAQRLPYVLPECDDEALYQRLMDTATATGTVDATQEARSTKAIEKIAHALADAWRPIFAEPPKEDPPEGPKEPKPDDKAEDDETPDSDEMREESDASGTSDDEPEKAPGDDDDETGEDEDAEPEESKGNAEESDDEESGAGEDKSEDEESGEELERDSRTVSPYESGESKEKNDKAPDLSRVFKDKLGATAKAPRTPYNRITTADTIVDYTGKRIDARAYGKYVERVRESAQQYAGTLRQKMLADLKCETFPWRGNQKRGKLNGHSIHKPSLGRIDAFRKQLPKRDLDVAVTVLVDMSGSMRGDQKSFLAATLAYTLGTTLRALAIPYELLGFTTRYGGKRGTNVRVPSDARACRVDPLMHYVIQSFGELIPEGELLNRCANTIREQHANNADGEAVQWAHDRLAQRREKRRILIVLSDGAPAARCACETDESTGVPRRARDILSNHLKDVCSDIERAGRVELIGVGIATNAVAQFYARHVVYTKPEQLMTEFYPTLRELLTGSR